MIKEIKSLSPPLVAAGKADLHGQTTEIEETEALVQTSFEKLDFEIEQISENSKVAFLEAQKHCPEYVKSKAFRLMFLRCERFEPTKTARRLVKYWEEKLRYFGPEKAYHPITIDDLQEEDIEILKSGAFVPIMNKDRYGRPIFFADSTKWKIEYSKRDSMVRALFYVVHSMLEDESAQRKGVVTLSTTRQRLQMRHFDRRLYKMLISIASDVMPVRNVAFHHVVRGGVAKLVLPYVMSMIGQHRRLRYARHEGYSHDILSELKGFGIPVDCVPREVGGAYHHDLEVWLEEQRTH